MITIKGIEEITITFPEWWVWVIIVVVIYLLVKGDYKSILQIIKKFINQ